MFDDLLAAVVAADPQACKEVPVEMPVAIPLL